MTSRIIAVGVDHEGLLTVLRLRLQLILALGFGIKRCSTCRVRPPDRVRLDRPKTLQYTQQHGKGCGLFRSDNLEAIKMAVTHQVHVKQPILYFIEH